MCIFVFLNNLVMDLVSLPEYVKVAHFCFSDGLGVLFVGCRFLCGCISCVYPLCSMVVIVLASFCLFFVDMG
jgi:hypothetical protein